MARSTTRRLLVAAVSVAVVQWACTLFVGKFKVSPAPRARRVVVREAPIDRAPTKLSTPSSEPEAEDQNAPEPESMSMASMKTKMSLLKLAASADRGQAYNPTSGGYYKERVEVGGDLIQELISHGSTLPTSLSAMDGEWELVFSTVEHGIFRSSPFFMAVQEAYNNREESDLFFKLHDLQVNSWGASKIGRVAQYINSTEGLLYSEVDTSLLSLTSVPVVGFWKLLPTFGGCFATTATVELADDRLEMEVQSTEAKEVPGLQPGLGFGPKVPVNEIWQTLPWNNGRRPTCSVTLKYLDEDMRIVEDRDGEYFVYTRPAAPRGITPR